MNMITLSCQTIERKEIQMTYEEAIEAKVTKAEAIRELEKHGLSFADFSKDHGNKATYKGSDVLAWMGY